MCTWHCALLQKYRDAAMVELEALNTLAANDPSQDLHCVQVRALLALPVAPGLWWQGH